MEKIVLKQGHIDILKGKIMTALFYEPSSRTFSSFVTAIQRLGGGFIPIHGISNSSVAKGETLADTARTFAKYADVIVMRHPKKGAARTAAQYSNVPVINAGDGIGEHPSQAMLDIFTIYKRHNKIDGLTVTFVGDMLNGRTVHSLSILLSRFNSITIQFISPKELQPSSKLVQWLRKRGVKVHIFEDLLSVLSKTDVLYVTRVQKERFADLLLYEKLKHKYIITMAEISRMKKSAIILHPFPRVGEVEEAVDSDPRAVYIQEQMKNGMYIRMTLLTLVLRKEDISAYFTNDLFVTLSKKSIHTDPIHTYNLFHKAIKKERDYHLVKSLGPETFHAATAQMRLSEFKSMYLNMLFPHLLPESKSTLMISERNIQLKNGEFGRTSSHIYLNHRIPLFNDIWDKKLLVKLLELVIHEKILPHGSIYGVVGISSSSSPELTTALHEGSPYSTSRISLLPINILKKEKGTHEPIYGEIDCTMPWIFIDDVFTSGNTFKKSLDQFRKGIPKNTPNIKTYAATLVNRNPSAALDFEEKTNMKVCSLITLDELLKYHWKHFSSLQKKLINSERNL
jgi:aspartate carbamoyltransferase